MFRVQTTISLGCEQFERVIEVDDIQTLTTEEREKLFDIATDPLSIEREEDEGESTAPEGRLCSTEGDTLIGVAPVSYTQNLVEHGLFEKDFNIKQKLDAINTLSRTEQYSKYVDALAASLMEGLGFTVIRDDVKTPKQG